MPRPDDTGPREPKEFQQTVNAFRDAIVNRARREGWDAAIFCAQNIPGFIYDTDMDPVVLGRIVAETQKKIINHMLAERPE